MPLTVSDAIGIFERAFRARNPNEIERVLRDNLNVRVAVIDSVEDAENKINGGYYPPTIRVPYWVFISKIKEKDRLRLEVFTLEQENIISEEDKKWRLEKIYSTNDILPNKTYFLLKKEAGYYPDLGLTFDGEGKTTGFEKIEEGEKAEKFGVGREQTWEEHAIGAYKRAGRILEIYRPFLIDWAKNVFSIQNLNEDQINETVDAIILAIKVSAFFHDIGKLRKEWQEKVGWEPDNSYIGRTKGLLRFTLNYIPQSKEDLVSTLRERGIKIDERELIKVENGWKVKKFLILRENNECKVYEFPKLPPHGRYAYPFLRKFLRSIWGNHRFLDAIALATARHHSLEATGKVEPNAFELIEEEQKIVDFLSNIMNSKNEFQDYDRNMLKNIIQDCIREVNEGSLMDEPPSPSDDFYFIYAITNRVVKLADWEDAGNEIIELPEGEGNDS